MFIRVKLTEDMRREALENGFVRYIPSMEVENLRRIYCEEIDFLFKLATPVDGKRAALLDAMSRFRAMRREVDRRIRDVWSDEDRIDIRIPMDDALTHKDHLLFRRCDEDTIRSKDVSYERTRDMEALSRVIDMGAHSLCPQSYEALTQILMELPRAREMHGECSRANASRSED
jgi:hypothetical protein